MSYFIPKSKEKIIYKVFKMKLLYKLHGTGDHFILNNL